MVVELSRYHAISKPLANRLIEYLIMKEFKQYSDTESRV